MRLCLAHRSPPSPGFQLCRAGFKPASPGSCSTIVLYHLSYRHKEAGKADPVLRHRNPPWRVSLSRLSRQGQGRAMRWDRHPTHHSVPPANGPRRRCERSGPPIFGASAGWRPPSWGARRRHLPRHGGSLTAIGSYGNFNGTNAVSRVGCSSCVGLSFFLAAAEQPA